MWNEEDAFKKEMGEFNINNSIYIIFIFRIRNRKFKFVYIFKNYYYDINVFKSFNIG